MLRLIYLSYIEAFRGIEKKIEVKDSNREFTAYRCPLYFAKGKLYSGHLNIKGSLGNSLMKIVLSGRSNSLFLSLLDDHISQLQDPLRELKRKGRKTLSDSLAFNFLRYFFDDPQPIHSLKRIEAVFFPLKISGSLI